MEKKDIDTKTKLISASKKIFAQHGYSGASVREICDVANVAVSAIHYHFKNKEGLFLKVIEDFSQEQLANTLQTLSEPTSKEVLYVRLEIFIESVLKTLIADPETFRIIQREIECQNPLMEEVFKNNILKIIEQLVLFFDQAKKNKIVKDHINTLEFAGIFMNLISSRIQSNHISERFFGNSILDDEYKKKWMKNTLEILLNGATTGQEKL